MRDLRFTPLLLTLAVALSACASRAGPAAGGASTGAATGPSGSPFPVTVQGTNGPLTLSRRPERIVSLSPTATEDLFAIGAGDQVVAVDEQSTYPPEAPRTKLTGLEPNVEAIATYRPDLVVYATETGDLGDALRKVGIPALQLDAAADVGDVYDQIHQLGFATGHADRADALVSTMRSEITDIAARTDPGGLTYYYELDDTYYSVTSSTFIGRLFAMLGLVDIADAAGKGSGGYPQLSAEYIVQADPDLILLADTRCCGQSAATVAARPGWDQIAAVRAGDVVPLDDDVASRWGPRIVDLLATVARAVNEAEAAA